MICGARAALWCEGVLPLPRPDQKETWGQLRQTLGTLRAPRRVGGPARSYECVQQPSTGPSVIGARRQEWRGRGACVERRRFTTRRFAAAQPSPSSSSSLRASSLRASVGPVLAPGPGNGGDHPSARGCIVAGLDPSQGPGGLDPRSIPFFVPKRDALGARGAGAGRRRRRSPPTRGASLFVADTASTPHATRHCFSPRQYYTVHRPLCL